MRDFTLTTGADVLNGSIANDVFEAFVVQNANGEQTNQLATGDRLNGSAGTDTLSATVVAASALNAGPSMAISPKTVGVENVAFTALTTSVSSVRNTETVEINAKFMNGLNHIGSVHSDASVLITNVNTLKNDGDYANKRNTEALTVRMDHSGNDAVTAESDLTVLLDNDYLLSGATTLSEALYHLLDEKAELDLMKGTAAAGTGRLAQIDTNGLTFTIDGKAYTLQSEAARLAGTHAGFVAELQKQLALDIAAGKIPAGVSLALDNTRTDTTGLKDGTISNAIPAIVLSVTSGEIKPTGFAKPADLTGQYDVYGVYGNQFDKAALPIAINVELEKVGRGSDGGDLTIGGMATDLKNEWDFSSSATLKEGIEKFNITVSGDASQFSSLASLQSTNNTLQTVVVTSAAGSKADLIIGNHNTEGAITNALKDVREFNSSTFANHVTVNASVTDESVAKYMNLKDGAPAAPVTDNAKFTYTFGTGNDTLNMNISKANLAASGSTVREDFSLTVNTAAGNDNVTVEIGDGKGLATDAWFINSHINRNLSIDTGNGNDTVSAKGAGTWSVTLGEGNDTVYSDNSGKKAVWVFNTKDQVTLGSAAVAAAATLADAKDTYTAAVTTWLASPANAGKTEADFVADIANETAVTEWTDAQADFAESAAGIRDLKNLVSDTNDTYKLYKATAEVSFKGIAAKAVIESSDYITSDLQINQAIKKAINTDPVLSKLLVAKDGPANTLVVTSLIDGDQVDTTDGDLTVTIAQGTGWTAAETSATTAKWAATTAVAFDDTTTDYKAQYAIDVVAGTEIKGAKSAQTTKNIIEGGAGDDVIVLSTGNDPVADTTGSVDTVVFKPNFGYDTIVNFTADEGGDKLDFSAIGKTVKTAEDASFTKVDGTSDTTTAEVLNAFGAGVSDNAAATTHVVIMHDGDNIGRVYQVTDAVNTGTNTVLLMGTIDLADTDWTTLVLAENGAGA